MEESKGLKGRDKPCIICGKLTPWIMMTQDELCVLNYQVFICSEECLERFDQLFQEKLEEVEKRKLNESNYSGKQIVGNFDAN